MFKSPQMPKTIHGDKTRPNCLPTNCLTSFLLTSCGIDRRRDRWSFVPYFSAIGTKPLSNPVHIFLNWNHQATKDTEEYWDARSVNHILMELKRRKELDALSRPNFHQKVEIQPTEGRKGRQAGWKKAPRSWRSSVRNDSSLNAEY